MSDQQEQAGDHASSDHTERMQQCLIELKLDPTCEAAQLRPLYRLVEALAADGHGQTIRELRTWLAKERVLRVAADERVEKLRDSIERVLSNEFGRRKTLRVLTAAMDATDFSSAVEDAA